MIALKKKDFSGVWNREKTERAIKKNKYFTGPDRKIFLLCEKYFIRKKRAMKAMIISVA